MLSMIFTRTTNPFFPKIVTCFASLNPLNTHTLSPHMKGFFDKFHFGVDHVAHFMLAALPDQDWH